MMKILASLSLEMTWNHSFLLIPKQIYIQYTLTLTNLNEIVGPIKISHEFYKNKLYNSNFYNSNLP